MHFDVPLDDVEADTNQTNLVPSGLSLASRKNPCCGWSRSSQNVEAKKKAGEEE